MLILMLIVLCLIQNVCRHRVGKLMTSLSAHVSLLITRSLGGPGHDTAGSLHLLNTAYPLLLSLISWPQILLKLQVKGL